MLVASALLTLASLTSPAASWTARSGPATVVVDPTTFSYAVHVENGEGSCGGKSWSMEDGAVARRNGSGMTSPKSLPATARFLTPLSLLRASAGATTAPTRSRACPGARRAGAARGLAHLLPTRKTPPAGRTLCRCAVARQPASARLARRVTARASPPTTPPPPRYLSAWAPRGPYHSP